MTTDRDLDLLEGLTMPTPETRWPPLDLHEFEDEVRVVDTFDQTYQPPAPPAEPVPEPVALIRHRLTWAERHQVDVDDLRMSLNQAHTSLTDTLDGCKATQYHREVTEQVVAAIDRVTEALRLVDIYDPA